MRAIGAGALALAAALAAGSAAHAQSVDVWGGGLAQACSLAAQNGSESTRDENVCTQSIETEQLVPLDRAGTYVNRGVIKLHGKRYAEAIKDFDIAIKYRSNLAEAYVNRGAAKIGLKEFQSALGDLDNAILLGVKETEKAYYNRAVAREWLDDYKDAWLDYQKALSIAPDWDLPRQQLARFTVSHPIEALPVVESPSAGPKP
jgi:tetratricopeptide (TPR) repeat protein